jgi:hypothetical protein
MADIALTAADIRDASPVNMAIKINLIASVAITAGQAIYIESAGKAALADASAAGTAVCIGIALEAAAIGQPVPVLVVGFVSGFTLSGLAYGALVKVSNTEAALDSGGSPTVSAPVGRVWSIGDSAQTKVIFLNCLHNLCILPA